jgi:hypothetical protein
MSLIHGNVMCPVTSWLVDALGARCFLPCIKHNCSSSKYAETLYGSCSKYAPCLQRRKENIEAGKVAVNYKPVDADIYVCTIGL